MRHFACKQKHWLTVGLDFLEQQYMTTVDATDARLATHEEICAIRYEQINARLKRLEAIMLKTAGVMILSMAGTIFSAVWVLK
jgi:hypothetical protein